MLRLHDDTDRGSRPCFDLSSEKLVAARKKEARATFRTGDTR